MLSRLKDWFGRPAGASSAEDDARRRLQAMALLMMEAARADLQAQERETRTIDEILQQHAGLDAAQAAELRQCAAAELDLARWRVAGIGRARSQRVAAPDHRAPQ